MKLLRNLELVASCLFPRALQKIGCLLHGHSPISYPQVGDYTVMTVRCRNCWEPLGGKYLPL